MGMDRRIGGNFGIIVKRDYVVDTSLLFNKIIAGN